MGSDYIRIPVNLIELTAFIMASILSGKKLDVNIVNDEDIDVNPQTAIELARFITKVIKTTQLSCTTFIFGIILTLRWSREVRKKRPGFYLIPRRKPAIQDLMNAFVAAIMTADKYLYDGTYTNATWVDMIGYRYTLDQLNTMEREFLIQIKFNIFVSELEYTDFLDFLDWHLVMRQLSHWRGWRTLTYSDVLRLSSRSSWFQRLYPFGLFSMLISFGLRYLMALLVLSALIGIIVSFVFKSPV